MFEFVWPWLLILLPLPLLIYVLPAKDTATAALKMPIVIKSLPVEQQVKKNNTSALLLFLIIWALLVISAARPQWLGDAVNIPTQGREMMIAVDLSRSMEIEDMTIGNSHVNRLEMLKVLLGDFISRRSGDRLGLILFADDAYMQTPMTFDRNTVRQMLDESVLGLVGNKTAIGDAIALAAKRFDDKENSNKVLLLLTDGQNTSGKISPEQATELAAAKGVTIYTIGIGADEMLQKSLFGTRRINPSSDLDEQSLKQIAQQTQGQYFRARNGKAMEEIYRLLDKYEPVEQEQKQMRPLTALFYYPLMLAFALSLLYLLWLELGSRLTLFSNNGHQE